MHQPPHILIVEDQYFVAIDSEMHLISAGFECSGLATTAAMAIEMATRNKPDLILMDIRLANLGDGVETAIEIYERLGIRCIFASGHADAKVRRDAQRAHPISWLDKPYTGEQLVAAVKSGLREVEGLTQELGRTEDEMLVRAH
jgi:DNA-binding NarL/FixJ family response regulator